MRLPDRRLRGNGRQRAAHPNLFEEMPIMAKGLKVALVLSLLLNVGLAGGFLGFKSYVGSQMFKMAAMTAEAEGRLLQSVLADIESDDPETIEALKEKLTLSIENANTAASIWRQAMK